MDSSSSYRKPFLVALALHIILLTALLVHFRSSFIQPSANINGPIIKAVAVNNTQLASLQPAPPPAKPVQATVQTPTPPAPKPVEKPQPSVKQVERTVLHEQKTPAKPPVSKTSVATKTPAKQVVVVKPVNSQQADAAAQQKQRRQKQLAEQKKLVAQQIQQEIAAQQQQQAKQEKQKQLQLAKAATQQLLQQQLAADAAASAQQAAQNQAELDKYKSMILQAISQQWIIPDQDQANLQGKLLVKVAPGGVVLNVTITQSSGDDALDRSARIAVFKASPLPVPQDPALFNQFRELSLTFRPEGVVG